MTEFGDLKVPSRNQSLRRPLGGRLRTYRPKPSSDSRLGAIRKALLRGELVLNGFNRWRLIASSIPAAHWTFVDAERIEAAAAAEVAIVRREAGNIPIAVADGSNVEQLTHRIEAGLERPELVVVQWDWMQAPRAGPSFAKLIRAARRRGSVVHMIAPLSSSGDAEDELYRDARHRWRLQREPLLQPVPSISGVERDFGERLRAAGFDPVPQQSVAQYFLDFAVVAESDKLPVRLDVEVDGRFWHEELPGQRRPSDLQRDRVVTRLGWRPVRFWADEVEEHPSECVDRVRRELASPVPLGG